MYLPARPPVEFGSPIRLVHAAYFHGVALHVGATIYNPDGSIRVAQRQLPGQKHRGERPGAQHLEVARRVQVGLPQTAAHHLPEIVDCHRGRVAGAKFGAGSTGSARANA